MELRSGRILQPTAFKSKKINHKAIANLVKQMRNLSIEDGKQKKDKKIMSQAKTFFNFLFYHCCEYFGNRVRLEEIERVQRRKPTLADHLNGRTDEAFWRQTFQKAWIRMREEIPSSTLLQAFYYFMKFEHPLELQEPGAFARMKGVMASYLQELYHQNNSARMVELMHQQEQLSSRAFPMPDKKVFFNELADDLASQIVNPIASQPDPKVIPWNRFFNSSMLRCCYIPEADGGRTVVRLPASFCNFSMFSSLMYRYKILETKETFTNPEKDIRKAFLLHQKLVEEKN